MNCSFPLSVVCSNRVPVEWRGARDNSGNTREGGNAASVTPHKSNQKRGESYLVLRLVCVPVSWRPGCVVAPGLWPSVPVLFLGLVPSCGSGPLASSFFVPRVCFKKEAMTQRPGFPTDRPRAERALGGGRE